MLMYNTYRKGVTTISKWHNLGTPVLELQETGSAGNGGNL